MIRVKSGVYVFGLLILCLQTVRAEPEEEQPMLELLEFLGDAEQSNGEWIDPIHMIDIDKIEIEAKQQEKNDE